MVTADLTVKFHVNITTISGMILDPTGSAIANGRAFVYPKSGPGIKIEADSNGIFSFDFAEGEKITFVCPEMMLDKKITVPARVAGVDSIDLRNIESVPRYDFPNIIFYR